MKYTMHILTVVACCIVAVIVGCGGFAEQKSAMVIEKADSGAENDASASTDVGTNDKDSGANVTDAGGNTDAGSTTQCAKDGDCRVPNIPCVRAVCVNGFCGADFQSGSCDDNNPNTINDQCWKTATSFGCSGTPVSQPDAGVNDAGTDAGIMVQCHMDSECVPTMVQCLKAVCVNGFCGADFQPGSCDDGDSSTINDTCWQNQSGFGCSGTPVSQPDAGVADAGTDAGYDAGQPVNHRFSEAADDTCTKWCSGSCGTVTSGNQSQEVSVEQNVSVVSCKKAPLACDGDPSKVCRVLPGHQNDAYPDYGCTFDGSGCAVYLNGTDGGTPDAGTDAGSSADSGTIECVQNSDCTVPAGQNDGCKASVCIGNKCSVASINEGNKCLDDGDVCTGDVCRSGTCQHEEIAGCKVTCGSKADCVTPGTAANLCVDVTCDSSSGTGICEYPLKDCGQGTGLQCLPRTGQCLPAAECYEDLDCPTTASSCRSVHCDTSSGKGKCVQTLYVDGTACDDGLWCTVGDHCVAGQCVSTARDCGAPSGPGYYRVCDEVNDICLERAF